jgi:hypothetical protein
MATYRELIQDIHARLDFTYDLIGALRDTATEDEKTIYNESRGLLGELARQWDRFDNRMSEARASMQLGWELPDWKYKKEKQQDQDYGNDEDE